MAEMFGHYRLEELLGQGGMGRVWKAFDTKSDRYVALKLLHLQFADTEGYRKRFEREARIAANLNDPHVVPIHSFGQLGDRLYIDMALINGTDVQTMLKKNGPMDPVQAADIVAQAAVALDAAHQAGLVHRDVKPSNLYVHTSGFVYLIDFGIAHRDDNSGLTETGAVIGTWSYMAPERFDGVIAPSVDIYALTCVLHECLTGKPPYGVTSPAQQVFAHMNKQPPRPSLARAGIPVELDAVIARGIAKKPGDRYATAGEFGQAAREAATKSTLPLKPRLQPKRSDVVPLAPNHADATIAQGPIPTQPRRPRADEEPTQVRGFPGQPPIRPQQPPARRGGLVAALAIVAVIVIALVAVGIWKFQAQDATQSPLAATSAPANTEPATAGAAASPKPPGPPTVIGRVPVGIKPWGVAVDYQTRTAFVTNSEENSVTVVNMNDRGVVGVIPIGNKPAAVAIDADAGIAYVTNASGGTVTFIDTRTRGVVGTVGVGGGPYGVAMDPRSRSAFVTNFDEGTVTVIDTGTRANVATIPVESGPYGIAIDTATQIAYVANGRSRSVSVIDTRARVVIATIPVGGEPWGLAVDSATNTVLVANHADGTVSVIDAQSRSVVATVNVGPGPVGVGVDTELATAYVANHGADTVSVLDIKTRAVTATPRVGNNPHGVGVDSGTRTAYVTDFGDATLSVITR